MDNLTKVIEDETNERAVSTYGINNMIITHKKLAISLDSIYSMGRIKYSELKDRDVELIRR